MHDLLTFTKHWRTNQGGLSQLHNFSYKKIPARDNRKGARGMEKIRISLSEENKRNTDNNCIRCN